MRNWHVGQVLQQPLNANACGFESFIWLARVPCQPGDCSSSCLQCWPCWPLQVDAAYQEEMLYKQQLLQTRRDQVLGEMDCAEVRVPHAPAYLLGCPGCQIHLEHLLMLSTVLDMEPAILLKIFRAGQSFCTMACSLGCIAVSLLICNKLSSSPCDGLSLGSQCRLLMLLGIEVGPRCIHQQSSSRMQAFTAFCTQCHEFQCCALADAAPCQSSKRQLVRSLTPMNKDT